MWFIFPQIAGLGTSAMAARYAIEDRAEAEAYLAHPVLGPRLRAVVEATLLHPDKSAHDIFGSPDDLKFRSCLTLFAEVGGGTVFATGLDTFFDGSKDPKTLDLLDGDASD